MYRSDLIVEELRKRKLTPEKFAAIIGSTGFTVRRAMSGGKVEVATLHLIAAGLNLQIKDLFEDVPTGVEPSNDVAKKLEAKRKLDSSLPSLFTDKIAA